VIPERSVPRCPPADILLTLGTRSFTLPPATLPPATTIHVHHIFFEKSPYRIPFRLFHLNSAIATTKFGNNFIPVVEFYKK